MASEPPALSRDKLHQDLEEHDRFPVFTSSAVKLPDQKDKTGILGKIKTLTARKSSSDSTGSMSISRSSRREAPIELEHPEFEMTYCMMLGIRTVLGTTHAKPLRILGIQDFIDCVKHRFPARGSKETPAHKMRDFKFKDYHPEVFRHIRQRFGIDAADYTLTVTNYHYLEFVSNSKSGQFFFFTHDTQFLIKTMSKVECKFLRKILPQYYAYVMANPNTLLTRFYGIHRVKMQNAKTVRFMIMGSVFYTDRFIHESYDLKGSTHGRAATASEKMQDVPVLKDLDFLEREVKIDIGEEKAAMFLDQLKKDTDFLKQHQVMDYSLLVGIHYPERASSEVMATPRPSIEEKIDDIVPERKRSSHRQSHFGLKSSQGLVKSPHLGTTLALEEEMEFPTPEEKKKTDIPAAAFIAPSSSAFTQCAGGIASFEKLPDGQPKVIYFVGLIDILQLYNPKKRAENAIKSFQYDPTSISAVHPGFYAERFMKFMTDAFEVTMQPLKDETLDRTPRKKPLPILLQKQAFTSQKSEPIPDYDEDVEENHDLA